MLADGEYDAIVMGTGLKEAIMSGLLSTLGMKVLLERYYYCCTRHSCKAGRAATRFRCLQAWLGVV